MALDDYDHPSAAGDPTCRRCWTVVPRGAEAKHDEWHRRLTGAIVAGDLGMLTTGEATLAPYQQAMAEGRW